MPAEPGSSLASRTRLKTLAKPTIDDNARFFKSRDEVPIYAITMGVGTILEAKKLVMVANLYNWKAHKKWNDFKQNRP